MRDPFPDDVPAPVRAAFHAMPRAVHRRMAELRALIFDVAARDGRIGALDETLKWGEPAYLPVARGRGSTVRLAVPRDRPGRCAICFICNTSMVDLFRDRFPGLDCVGNRAVLVDPAAPVPGAVRNCIATALGWHLDRAVRA